MVPPRDRESGFYSRYFIVPKKDGIASNSRSKTIEPLSHETQFQLLTINKVVSQIRSKDWIVTLDLKDPLTSIYPFYPNIRSS